MLSDYFLFQKYHSRQYANSNNSKQYDQYES